MRSWAEPPLSADLVRRIGPAKPLALFDTRTGAIAPTGAGGPDDRARLYVCGITPYDATHLGHANTYVTFDLALRVWRDAGLTTRYAQNVTDVDDPLLQRAADTGVAWQDLAERETALFREDMAALGVLPPDEYVAVTEAVGPIGAAVGRLLEQGAAYRVDEDVYFCVDSDPKYGEVSHLSADVQLKLSAERGGDPDRPGKRAAREPPLRRP